MNLLSAITSSVDSTLFRHLYVKDEDGNELDVLEDEHSHARIL